MTARDVIRIETPDDPRIAAFRNIRERDLVGRAGQFVAEGEVVLRVLARAPRHRALALLIVEHRVAALGALIARFPPEVPLYTLSQEVADAIAGFPLHRGLLALGERAPDPDVAALVDSLPARSVVILACAIANHDNIGGIYRNAAAFGVGGVILDGACCDPLYRKAIRVSVGATLLVPTARATSAGAALAVLRAHGFTPYALSPQGAHTLKALVPAPRSALVLGTEGPGLPAAILDQCETVAIPMANGFDSLNVATTSGIALHHFLGGNDA